MMNRNLKFCLVLISLLVSVVFTGNSQTLVESIAAIVGNEVIYLSDLENTITDLRRRENKAPIDQLRCNVFDQMLISKLFLDQARIDSITVTDDSVEGELNMRMNDAIRQAKSEEVLVESFGKSMIEIRRDIKKNMLENYPMPNILEKMGFI